VPVKPVVGSPVRFVATPEAGVPSAGVTNVGLFSVTVEPAAPVSVPPLGIVSVFPVRMLPVRPPLRVSNPLNAPVVPLTVPPLRFVAVVAVEALPVKAPLKVPVVVPGRVGLLGMLRVNEPASVIGEVPVTVIWFAVPTSPTLVTVPEPPPPPPVARLLAPGDELMTITAVPLVKAEHRTRRFVMAATEKAHVPTAVAEVTEEPLGWGKPEAATHETPLSALSSNCNVADHVPVTATLAVDGWRPGLVGSTSETQAFEVAQVEAAAWILPEVDVDCALVRKGRQSRNKSMAVLILITLHKYLSCFQLPTQI
jgi:hypothetical protein